MSDDAFYDSGAMSEREIQTFLDGLDCRPVDDVPCLADYRETTTTQPAVGGEHCAEYRGASRERASRIIAKVAVACGVSPRTLLVLLQKEQSLLTRPGASGYERATGYGCPDTADCDTRYFGFFNQLYHAAWQFRQYTEEPKRQYRIGTRAGAVPPRRGVRRDSRSTCRTRRPRTSTTTRPTSRTRRRSPRPRPATRARRSAI